MTEAEKVFLAGMKSYVVLKAQWSPVAHKLAMGLVKKGALIRVPKGDYDMFVKVL